jgi:hypothetical protein
MGIEVGAKSTHIPLTLNTPARPRSLAPASRRRNPQFVRVFKKGERVMDDLLGGKEPSLDDYGAFVFVCEKLTVEELYRLAIGFPSMHCTLRGVVTKELAEKVRQEKYLHHAASLTQRLKERLAGLSPGGSNDEKLRFLQMREELQPDHLLVLKALAAEPDANPGMGGSPIQTLMTRLPQMSEARVADLISQLDDMGLTNLVESLRASMTGLGAADLRHYITEYGRRFLD